MDYSPNIFFCHGIYQSPILLPQVCTQRCLDRGAAGSGRSDDNMESLKKRFDTYMNATMPIIKHYEEKDLVRTMDAAKGPDDIFVEVEKLFS